MKVIKFFKNVIWKVGVPRKPSFQTPFSIKIFFSVFSCLGPKKTSDYTLVTAPKFFMSQGSLTSSRPSATNLFSRHAGLSPTLCCLSKYQCQLWSHHSKTVHWSNTNCERPSEFYVLGQSCELWRWVICFKEVPLSNTFYGRRSAIRKEFNRWYRYLRTQKEQLMATCQTFLQDDL